MTTDLKLARGIDRLVDVVGGIFAWTSFLLVVVMATNVLMRYLFSTGSVWAQELEWHLLVPLSLIGIAYAARHGEHVRVDIFFARYPDRIKHAVDLIGHVTFVLIALLVVMLSWRYVMQSWNLREGSANPGGIDQRYLLKAFLPLGFTLLALQSLSDALKSASRFRERV